MNRIVYSYEWGNNYIPGLPVIVALHGFTGTKESFRSLAQKMPSINWLLIDQIGHGATYPKEILSNYAYSRVIDDLALFLEEQSIHQYGLLGYSMGARVALGWAIKYPNRIWTLILESGSPGLYSIEERIERQEKDKKLANRLLSEPLENFVEFWQKLPLFDSQKKITEEIRQKIREERLSQEPIGLANSLLGMGTGSQPSFWEEMAHLPIKTMYIYGEWDSKFRTIAQDMKKKWPTLTLIEMKKAGHCAHIEQPEAFRHEVEKWIEERG